MGLQQPGNYAIGIVAQLTGMHQQTIRTYEKIGLISPSRSPLGTRYFSDSDVARLLAITELTQNMGVNLAGVEIILRMRQREWELMHTVRDMLEALDDEARAHFAAVLHGNLPGLVRAEPAHLVRQE